MNIQNQPQLTEKWKRNRESYKTLKGSRTAETTEAGEERGSTLQFSMQNRLLNNEILVKSIESLGTVSDNAMHQGSLVKLVDLQ
jgi:hypothetical protein